MKPPVMPQATEPPQPEYLLVEVVSGRVWGRLDGEGMGGRVRSGIDGEGNGWTDWVKEAEKACWRVARLEGAAMARAALLRRRLRSMVVDGERSKGV